MNCTRMNQRSRLFFLTLVLTLSLLLDYGLAQAQNTIETFGSVSLAAAVKTAQTALSVSNTPFEVTLQNDEGQLVWLLDFVEPAQEVIVNADSGAVVSTADLTDVPSASETLSDYGSLTMEQLVAIAKNAYGSPGAVTEFALEKETEKGILTWLVNVADKLVTIDANSGEVLSVGEPD
jgi:uncharacterized membrane protein YkoI